MKLDHPHLTLARTLWSAAADGDAEALGLLFDEDVCWRTIGLNPLSGEYRGPEEVLDFLAQVGEASDEFSSQLGSVYVNDEGVRNSLIVEALTVPVDQRTNDQFWS
jgi:ketosteroid isomerase-like protein